MNKKTMTSAVGADASNSGPEEVQNEIPPPPTLGVIELRSQLRFDFLTRLMRRLMDNLSLQCEQ